MGRIVRTCGSFGMMLVAYWAYAVVAVPLIEPPAARYESGTPSAADLEDARQRVDHRLDELVGLFPPGSWELDSPQILESDRVKLLVPSYENRPDGSVKFPRCTIMLTPDAPKADPAERKRRTVILQASEGALLKFDQPLSLSGGTGFGELRLESGMLQGQVTIRSQGKSPGPEDDLLIRTREVKLTKDEISTPHAVEFRLGPNHGSGSDMQISLMADEDHSNGHGLNVTGVEWFELRRLDQLCLWLPPHSDTPGGARQPTAAGRADRNEGVPIEIKCQGPFRYDHIRQELSFENQVDVLRINPGGPADKITCERLSVFFARSRQAVGDLMKPASKDRERLGSGEFDLEPCRIEAWGNPVDIHAPSEDVYARAEHLEHDLQRKRTILDYPDDGRRHAEVWLRKGANEIHGRSLQYESAGPGRLGQITAAGPGWIRAQNNDRPPKQLEASWGNQLLVQPHEGQQVISLTGNSKLTFSQLGTLTAGEIHFWLFESPPDDSTPDGQPELSPDRMSALHNVRLDSPQLTGAVEELGIWFKEKEPLGGPAEVAPVATGRITGVLPVYRPNEPTDRAGRQPAAPPSRLQRYDITGSKLTSQVVILGDEPKVSELTVEGNVVFRETQTAEPGEIPLTLTGNLVQVFNADTPDTKVVLVGLNPPARLEGRGLTLSGTNIKLYRGSNRLWVNGMGQMELPLKRDMEGRPLARPGVLNIDWQEKMEFDGRTVSFFESVVATGPNQRMATEELRVSLLEPIDFSDPSMDQEPDVARIECSGGVVMENWSFDGPAQTSWDRMQNADLSIDRVSGEIVGRGPGRVTTVRIGRPEVPGSPFGAAPDGNRPAKTEGDPNQLAYLNVEFQDRIEGNLHHRTLTFYDQVHCVYGPVESWDATLDIDDPDSLGPKGALLTSDALTVTQIATPLEGDSSLELLAQGNVRVEGSMFNAWGHRMSYDQAKDLLILEGTGRADAQLFYQKRVGAPTQNVQMGKIRYRPKTNEIQLDDASSVDLNQFPSP